jgi:hypothetical protein
MTFGEILDAVRDHYVTRLSAVIAEERARVPKVKVVTEAAYLTADGKVAREGFFASPLRQDIFVLDESGRSIQVQTEGAITFPKVSFEWEGVPVVIGPFRWNECRTRLTGVGRGADWKPLTGWFSAWFDETDHHAPLADGLKGAVHFLSDPEFDAGAARLCLDLGSAPVEAFEHLLDALARLRPTTIEIGEIA